MKKAEIIIAILALIAIGMSLMLIDGGCNIHSSIPVNAFFHVFRFQFCTFKWYKTKVYL